MSDENLLQDWALILFPALFWFSISLQTQGSLMLSQSCSRLLITWSLLLTLNSFWRNFQSLAVTVFEKAFNNFKVLQKYIILSSSALSKGLGAIETPWCSHHCPTWGAAVLTPNSTAVPLFHIAEDKWSFQVSHGPPLQSYPFDVWLLFQYTYSYFLKWICAKNKDHWTQMCQNSIGLICREHAFLHCQLCDFKMKSPDICCLSKWPVSWRLVIVRLSTFI